MPLASTLQSFRAGVLHPDEPKQGPRSSLYSNSHLSPSSSLKDSYPRGETGPSPMRDSYSRKEAGASPLDGRLANLLATSDNRAHSKASPRDYTRSNELSPAAMSSSMNPYKATPSPRLITEPNDFQHRPNYKVLQQTTSEMMKCDDPPPQSVQAATQEKLNVFNYEGGDKGANRNQLHMMMNHNMMNAYNPPEEPKTKNSKRNKRRITVNLANTRYEIVKEVVQSLGYSVSKDDDNSAYLHWNDSFVSTDRISELKPFQRINHFPGMGEICRKDCLARNMSKMQKCHPEEYDFVPKTWILPQDYNALQNHAKDLKKKKKSKCFIAKPSNGAMGNGISLYYNAERIPPSEHYVVQEYIDRPFLIDGFKCDLRIYVLVLSCDPLKIFLFNDGLVRMSTEKYKDPTPQNMDVLFMHLTNYSINKHSDTYEKGGSVSTGSKRSLKFLNDSMRQNGLDVTGVWNNISDVIVKTLICAMPHLNHAYKMCRPGQPPNSDSVCFEILGFDIMLDRKLKPWLVEVNRSPSFGTNEDIDYMIKSALINDTLKLVNIRVSDKKKNLAAQKAATQKRLLQPRGALESEDRRRKLNQDKRKTELKDLLSRIRRENAQNEFEDRMCGRFRRIFPPEDRYKQEKYARLLLSGFSTLVTGMGKNGTMAREIERQYIKKYREDEVMDMLAQYEADEAAADGHTKPYGPAPLTAMPSSSHNPREPKYSDDDTDSDCSEEGKSREPSSRPATRQRISSSRPQSSGVIRPQRSGSAVKSGRSRNLKFSLSEDADAMNRATKEKEDQLVQTVRNALIEMRIKFPGKTDGEAEAILGALVENWKYHKPRVASYWLVKLDSIKRRKVIDIVRSNVKAKVQHIYQSGDVESLRLFRVFSRVFNRLLWSHGQGLWNCFTPPGNTWETIFSKSTDVISQSELLCCRRIVQLCKDCLLIVYQFASEARDKQQQQQEMDENQVEGKEKATKPPALSHPSWKPNTHTLSTKYSQIYTNAVIAYRS